jgi:hypothetical protein
LLSARSKPNAVSAALSAEEWLAAGIPSLLLSPPDSDFMIWIRDRAPDLIVHLQAETKGYWCTICLKNL